ncbi:hypothetical protein PFISCL1PPCAC_26765, partial [Pristionchus fissidentatus]
LISGFSLDSCGSLLSRVSHGSCGSSRSLFTCDSFRPIYPLPSRRSRHSLLSRAANVASGSMWSWGSFRAWRSGRSGSGAAVGSGRPEMAATRVRRVSHRREGAVCTGSLASIVLSVSPHSTRTHQLIHGLFVHEHHGFRIETDQSIAIRSQFSVIDEEAAQPPVFVFMRKISRPNDGGKSATTASSIAWIRLRGAEEKNQQQKTFE